MPNEKKKTHKTPKWPLVHSSVTAVKMTESTTLVKVLGTEGETNLVLKSEGCLFQHFWWLTEGYSQRPAFISPILELPNGSGSYWRSSWCCSVAQLCPTICSPMDCSIPGFPGHHHLRELAQTHVHWVGDAIQSSCPLSSPSPPAFYQCFFFDP